MKKIFILALAISSAQYLFAQTSTEISRDASGHKILKGFIDQKQLASDTAFAWYAQNLKSFTPNSDVVKNYASSKDSVNIIVFGGTWCGDTQSLLPKFYATAEAAGLPSNHITLIGVDESKKTLFNLAEAFGVTNVPTFIVMKNGKEVGRVVEYGKTGQPEKEVGEIISNSIIKTSPASKAKAK
jgi:thiol-disulfide isomerase/thioredoxin